MIIWVVGLSGAGKTTLAREIVRQWRAAAPNTVLVDGDEIRAMLRDDSGTAPYTVEGRRRNAERITELCAWLDAQGINAVCSILCIFPDILAANRTRFSRYLEVFLETPLETVIANDSKGIYAPALRGETSQVVGLDIPFPAPERPDVVIDNRAGWRDTREAAAEVLRRAQVNLAR